MDDQKKSAQLRYLEELALCLQRADFDVAKVANEEKLFSYHPKSMKRRRKTL